MPPSRWFAVGSADGSELGAGARAAGGGMRGFHNQTLIALSIA
jgi:hypothetical protein